MSLVGLSPVPLQRLHFLLVLPCLLLPRLLLWQRDLDLELELLFLFRLLSLRRRLSGEEELGLEVGELLLRFEQRFRRRPLELERPLELVLLSVLAVDLPLDLPLPLHLPLPLPLPLPLLLSLELDAQLELEELWLRPELLDCLAVRARVTGPSARPRFDGPAVGSGSPRVDPGGPGLQEPSLLCLLLLRAIFPIERVRGRVRAIGLYTSDVKRFHDVATHFPTAKIQVQTRMLTSAPENFSIVIS